MVDTYSDDFGLLDFRRSQHGSGMSSRSQVQSINYQIRIVNFQSTGVYLCAVKFDSGNISLDSDTAVIG